MKADNFDLRKYLSNNILLENEKINAEDIITMIGNNDYDALNNLSPDKELLKQVIKLLKQPENEVEKNKINQMSCELKELKNKNTFLALLLSVASILGGCSSQSQETIPQEKAKTELNIKDYDSYMASEINQSPTLALFHHKEKNPKLIYGDDDNEFKGYTYSPTVLHTTDDNKYILTSESGNRGSYSSVYDNKNKLLNNLKLGIKAFEKAKETNTFKQYKDVDGVFMVSSVRGNNGLSDGFTLPGGGDQHITYEDALEIVNLLN